jgi:hypothetical protein
MLVVAPPIGTTIRRGIALTDEHEQQKGPQPMGSGATIEDSESDRAEADHVPADLTLEVL